MSVLPPLPLPPGGRDDARVAAALRSAAAAAVARYGSGLRQAAVAVWETRLRGPHREAAWRVVVSMPTGEVWVIWGGGRGERMGGRGGGSRVREGTEVTCSGEIQW